MYLLP